MYISIYLSIYIYLYIYKQRVCACASSSGMWCRDWSSHASRTMSSIKTNVYGAALEHGPEDHKGVDSCRRQQITS